ncbi:MAG: AraC family transcriptional regulator [Pyrinomonadaceae bacterium]
MDVLSDILRTVQVEGSLYFRTAFSPPWGVIVPPYKNVSRYHLVVRGSCFVYIEGFEKPLRLEKGDLILITNGTEHRLCYSVDTECLTLDEVLDKSGFDGKGALVWGEDDPGETTSLVCGHFAFESERGKLLLNALPPFIHVPNTEILHYGWLDSATKFITHEAFKRELGSDAVINRLAEIIFIQTIRTFAKSNGHTQNLFAALIDPQISQVLEQMHRRPERAWTVDGLARTAGMSRTILSERMRDVLGISPMAYLTQWRMELAHEALTRGRDGIPEISEAVGYQSLSAFTRAFKKHFGRGPGAVRRAGQTV